MNLPNLTRIVETAVPAESLEREAYLAQLRRDVLMAIRALQAENLLGWYSILLHGAQQWHEALGFEQGGAYIHLHLEVRQGIEVNHFIGRLPSQFRNPRCIAIDPAFPGPGVNEALFQNGDWNYGRAMIGQCSAFVLALLESHGEADPAPNLGQFLHYIANPLLLR